MNLSIAVLQNSRQISNDNLQGTGYNNIITTDLLIHGSNTTECHIMLFEKNRNSKVQELHTKQIFPYSIILLCLYNIKIIFKSLLCHDTKCKSKIPDAICINEVFQF